MFPRDTLPYNHPEMIKNRKLAAMNAKKPFYGTGLNALINGISFFNKPTNNKYITSDRQGPPELKELSRTGVRTVTRDGRGIESVFGQLDYPGLKYDRDFNKTVVAGTNLSPGQYSRSKDFAVNNIVSDNMVSTIQRNTNELRAEAIEAYKNPETRLSKNLDMHIERYKIRNR